MMEEYQNNQLKYAILLEPLLDDINYNVKNAIDSILKTLKTNYDDVLNRHDFSDYIPESIKILTTKETNKYVSDALKSIMNLRKIKLEMNKQEISLANTPLLDVISDGGVICEVADLFSFVAQNKSIQPLLDYYDSVKRYSEGLVEFIKITKDPGYYSYVQDSSIAKF